MAPLGEMLAYERHPIPIGGDCEHGWIFLAESITKPRTMWPESLIFSLCGRNAAFGASVIVAGFADLAASEAAQRKQISAFQSTVSDI